MSIASERVKLIDDSSLRGRAFTDAYTLVVDQWIVGLFTDAFGEPSDVALLATGGHGRGELAPYSDLDLLLVHRGSIDADAVQRLWYPMWDAGFKVGHATRTVSETLQLASGDLATATALLSTRHLAGSEALSGSMADAAAAQWSKNSKSWVQELAATVQARQLATGEVAAALEPDLKEGRGGLRDVHTMRWLIAAQPTLDISNPDLLSEHYDSLLEARVELHRIAGRGRDLLRLQDHDEIATRLGDEGSEALMTRLVSAARHISWASDEAWFESLQRSSGGLFRRAPRRRDLAGGVELVAGRVELIEGTRVDELSLLRVAVAAAEQRARIGRATLDWLRDAPLLGEPWPAEARQLFIELLASGAPAIAVIETLDLAGLWLRLMPEWEPVRSRPQRNAYHRFTVDRHLWECVAGAAALSADVERADLLLMGALLHDIGKGYPGDHAIVGVDIACRVMRRMGYPEDDVATVAALVEHHLLLPDVATRRDLDDPATILMVASRAGSAERLRLLQALTIADSIATGPAAWSPWKASLIETLVERAIFAADGGDVAAVIAAPVATEHQLDLLHRGSTEARPVVDGRDDRLTIVCSDRPGLLSGAAGALALNGLDVLEATTHSADGLAIEEFRVVSAFGSDIAWTKVVRDVERAIGGRMALEPRLDERARSYRPSHPVQRGLEPRVRVLQNEASDGATVVEVVGPDSIGLLYRLTHAMADLDLDILRAKVATMGSDVVDTFYVRDRSGGEITDEHDAAEIRSALLHVLNRPQF